MKRVLVLLLVVLVVAALWWFGYRSPEDTGPAPAPAPAAEGGPPEEQLPPPLDESSMPAAPHSHEPGRPPEPTGGETPWTPDPNGQPIAGWVLTENGDPIPGATVLIHRRTEDGYIHPPGLVAGEDGSFRLEGLTEGLWNVWAGSDLRTSAWMGEVAAGRIDLLLTLSSAAELRVRAVVSKDIEIPSAVTVQYTVDRWIEEDEEYRRHREFVRKMLEFTVDSLPTGRYRVEVRVVGIGLGSVADIEAKAGESKAVDVPILEGAVIEGIVLTEEGGDPVPGALVVVGRKGDGTPPMYVMDEDMAVWNNCVPTRTDAEGKFRVPGLESGPHDVAVRAKGRRPSLQEGVFAPTEDAPLLVRLEAGGAVAILVLGPDGKPVPDANVSAFIPGGGEFDATTDDSGNAVIRGLPPGETEVGVWTDRWGAKAVLRVEAGKTSRVTLRPPPGKAVLAGRIVRDGQPVSDRRVWAQFPDESGRVITLIAQSGTDGKYSIAGLPRGEVELALNDSHGYQRALGKRVLQPGKNTFDIELPAGVVLLRVIDGRNGEGASFARVFRGEDWLESADEDGVVRITELPGTALELFVSRPPDLAARRVSVLPSREPGETVVTLPAAARLVVRFVDSVKRPVPLPGVYLELFDGSGGKIRRAAAMDGQDGGADGQIRLGLAPGKYRLVAWRDGGDKVSRDIRLFDSGVEVEIQLP